MIDVVFQLILFFLVSTTFANLQSINVNFPVSETAQAEVLEELTISVTASGKFYFNEEQVNFKTLDQRLKSYDTKDKKREDYPVTLAADEKVTNGTIVKIFDVLRKNGFVSVNLRTTD